ncbi:MAG: acyltransferase family protein, partial [Acidimicrobiales bacterium]
IVAGFAVPGFLAGRRWRHGLGVSALAALVAAMVLGGVGQPWLYRGGFWIIATLSVVLIVSALDDGPVSRVLAWRPLAALGLISYGVYLYHWPLFAWLTADRLGVDGLALAVIRVTLTLAVAVASYVLLEQPIRQGRLSLAARPAVAAGSVLAVACTLVAVTTFLDGEAERRAVAASPTGLQLNVSVGEGPSTGEEDPGADRAGSSPGATPPLQRVLILGDSLVHQSYPSIRDRLTRAGVDSMVIGGPGQHLMKNDGAWQGELDRAITSYEPDLVLLESCCGWGSPWQRETYRAPDGRVIEPDTPDSWAEWERLAYALTERARRGGRPVAWVLAPPAQTNGYYGPIEGRIDRVNDLYRRIARCDPGVGLVDWRVMSGADGAFAWDLPDADGRPVRIRADDGLHFTPAGQAVVADLTRDALLGLWQRSGGHVDVPPGTGSSCP